MLVAKANRIGRLNVKSGAIEEFEIPTPNSGPYGIIADADGNARFCSFGPGSNRIGRVDAQTGAITEYAEHLTPTPARAVPGSIPRAESGLQNSRLASW